MVMRFEENGQNECVMTELMSILVNGSPTFAFPIAEGSETRRLVVCYSYRPKKKSLAYIDGTSFS